jgi:hypothetical protein
LTPCSAGVEGLCSLSLNEAWLTDGNGIATKDVSYLHQQLSTRNAWPVRGLDSDMEVETKQHERPEEHGQDEGQKFANSGEHISVRVRHHCTDNYIDETKKRTAEHVSSSKLRTIEDR